ncbi:MAG: alcohol dehydrogenase catalytic domain-containing protein [Gammaproteobacteria bacterium]|nr:zinc-binding dehydrogenase [Rhodocyclaceae bacterium]MBU3909043.1 alcohol dehydrogenase catalytic domain-containing protein [Gammaproteobacteria bacterium]MBU3990376.1 alcohol dehydrogenase catalytic domain-containing protein [Gammaproteobacteria bacterium]MBU4003030.1 alcohol dehydrogenase catalytic domain-containing protein [Gammaproteobacteria bacterium]MBU4019875.1 alcohol dehydrogenase catalytic domain-containing protein [Gammaproteobacteria bacterium]
MEIRAAVLDRMESPRPYAQSRPLAVETVNLAGPGVNEVLVRITGAGLCHSDLSIINGDRPRPMPMVLGHEAAGIVAEVGPGVSDLVRGDAVALVFVPSCGHCLPCLEGRPALCEPGAAANVAGTMVGGHRHLSRTGNVPLNHQVGVSCFAEYAVCNRGSLVKVDPDLPPEVAAVFGCAVLTGVGAAINAAQVRLGQSVAVVGLGGVGLSAVLGALAAGAREVIVLDTLPAKLDAALALGATRGFRADDPEVVNQVRAATQGGVEVVIEAASNIAALDTAYRITRRGGTTVTCSLTPPAHTLNVPGVHLVVEERTLKGSYLGSAVPARDIPHYIALFKAGRLPVDKLITHRLTLDQINEGFDRLASGAAVRQVILF